VHERDIAALRGRNDFASCQDLAAAQVRLDEARFQQQTSERVNQMVPLPPKIRLNSEDLITTKRVASAEEGCHKRVTALQYQGFIDKLAVLASLENG
jgi:hypothetical protein